MGKMFEMLFKALTALFSSVYRVATVAENQSAVWASESEAEAVEKLVRNKSKVTNNEREELRKILRDF